MNTNYNQFKNELNNRFTKNLDKIDNQHDKIKVDIIKKKEISRSKKIKIKQEILVLDSEDRDKTIYPSPSDFILKTIEVFKHVVAVRLIRTEYTYTDTQFDLVSVNNQNIPFQFYKPVHAFIYFNGYNKIKIANKLTTPIFSQISPGIENLPPCNDNIKLDPYAYIINPIEEKLDRFEIKLLNNNGQTININNPDKIRLILTFAIYIIV
tara:strand:+ start:3580 stop:4206 length:627 start_codon:yes stop_codon:yes gene_type:complete